MPVRNREEALARQSPTEPDTEKSRQTLALSRWEEATRSSDLGMPLLLPLRRWERKQKSGLWEFFAGHDDFVRYRWIGNLLFQGWPANPKHD